MFKGTCYITKSLVLMGETRGGEPEQSQSDPGVFSSLEPEQLGKNPGDGAGAALKKKQEPEQLKNWPAPQLCEKIKSIMKLYFSYSVTL